eukprot:1541343-Pleurochrysis_carterae.AAC.1
MCAAGTAVASQQDELSAGPCTFWIVDLCELAGAQLASHGKESVAEDEEPQDRKGRHGAPAGSCEITIGGCGTADKI